jgi:glyoxylase I family protein
VGLNVADLVAAQHWYCEAFGFRSEFATRIEAIDLDLVMLLHPGHGDRLELLHRGGSAPGPRAQGPADAALIEGFGHVAFELADLDAGYERLLTLGARPVLAPAAAPEPNVRMAFVADPEGNLIELLDRTELSD